MAESYQSRIVRFSVFEVDLNAGELRKNGLKVKLQEQPFRLSGCWSLSFDARATSSREKSCVGNYGLPTHLLISITASMRP